MKINTMLTWLSILLTSAIILVSCNKKDDLPHTDPVPIPVTKKVWKIKTNDSDSTLFAYTTTGELFKVISTEGGNSGERVTHTFMYEPNTSRVTEISSEDGVKYTFSYDNNRLRMTQNYIGTEIVSQNVIEWENDKISSNTLFTAFPRGNGNITYWPTFKTSYTYDASGYVKKATSYHLDTGSYVPVKIDEKEIAQYDNFNNPLAVLAPLALVTVYEIPGAHNTIKETLFDRDGLEDERTVNSFVYDADKYPVSSTSTVTPAGGTPVTKTFKYYYK